MSKEELKKTLKRLEVLAKLRSKIPELNKLKDNVWEMCKTVDNCNKCPFNVIDPPIYQGNCVWSLILEIRTLIENM